MIEVKVFPTGYIDPDKQKLVLRTLEEGWTITVCKLIWIITFRMITDYNDLIVLGYISTKIPAHRRNASLQECYIRWFFCLMWLLCDLFVCAHTFRWVSQKTEITRSQLIDLSTVFVLFFSFFESMADKLEKVRRLHCKSVKLPSLKAIVENELRYSFSKSCQTFVCWGEGGHKLAPPPSPQHTNVCKFLQLRRVISSLA